MTPYTKQDSEVIKDKISVIIESSSSNYLVTVSSTELNVIYYNKNSVSFRTEINIDVPKDDPINVQIIN